MIRGDHSSTPSIPPQTDLPPDFYDQPIGFGANMCVLKQTDLCFSHRCTQCCSIVTFKSLYCVMCKIPFPPTGIRIGSHRKYNYTLALEDHSHSHLSACGPCRTGNANHIL